MPMQWPNSWIMMEPASSAVLISPPSLTESVLLTTMSASSSSQSLASPMYGQKHGADVLWLTPLLEHRTREVNRPLVKRG